jgi:hypothetical protein
MQKNVKKVGFLLIIFAVLFANHDLVAQEAGLQGFSPKGKPIIKVFSNFHASISEGDDESALEIKRAYFGYDYKISPDFSIIVKLDIGSPDDMSAYSLIKRYAYFKNAALKYKKGKVSASFGLIDMTLFKLQEKFWSYRYLYKSFLDQHRFGSSADIGASFTYEINDFLSADISIMNGEGYNQLQADNTYKGSVGLTFKPISGVVGRLYYDQSQKEMAESTVASFLGYKYKKVFRVGAEYNLKLNTSYADKNNQYGFSTYATYIFNKHFEVFGRYDRLSSNKLKGEERPWNLIDDGTAIIGGVQYSPIKHVRIALNYQDWYPMAKNSDSEAYIYLSFEYKID